MESNGSITGAGDVAGDFVIVAPPVLDPEIFLHGPITGEAETDGQRQTAGGAARPENW